MTDIVEEILSNYDYDVHYYGSGKERVLEAMDEYAIKILQNLYDTGQAFQEADSFDAKRLLEEIKTELNAEIK